MQPKTNNQQPAAFVQLTERTHHIERQWNALIQSLVAGCEYSSGLKPEDFYELNAKFTTAVARLRKELETPTLILATTGTTSSGKSTIINLLCGAELMPRMAQEMSAGVVTLHHTTHKKTCLHIHQTASAKWECGQWHDLSAADILEKITQVMDAFNEHKTEQKLLAPSIELTYPLACFSDSSLLDLSTLPQSTRFQLMDLPGLRNTQNDYTNKGAIESCKNALSLVAYNMEETDESRRTALVNEVLEQVKNMGGSPARMLFVLNRIDVFRKDKNWEKYQEQHTEKVTKEITDLLRTKLPEHNDTALAFCRLSSLPAVYARHIQTHQNRSVAATKLDKDFGNLIPDDVTDDLPRNTSKWTDCDYQRVHDVVWQASYGNEFFGKLNHHIQNHFPTLVIPPMISRFHKETDSIVSGITETCYAQINSSEKRYNEAIAKLFQQNAELKEFIEKSKDELLKPLGNVRETLSKKNEKEKDIGSSIQGVIEKLSSTTAFASIDKNKLYPLRGWRKELNQASMGILAGVEQSLSEKKCNFIDTGADNLPPIEKKLLRSACTTYINAIEKNDSERVEEQLEEFVEDIHAIIFKSLERTVSQENGRIHAAMQYLMKDYLNYVREGIINKAPEWNLSIGDYVLDGIKAPEIKLSALNAEIEEVIEQRIEQRTRDVQKTKVKQVRRWFTLFLYKHKKEDTYMDRENYNVTVDVNVKRLPESDVLCSKIKEQLSIELNDLFVPFVDIIINYIESVSNVIDKEQERILGDVKLKLDKTQSNLKIDHEKVLRYWEPINQQSKDFETELKNLMFNIY